MAGGFPVGAQWSAIQSTAYGTTYGVIATAGTTPNTLTAYVQLIASTTRDSTWCMVTLVDYIPTVGLASGAVNIAVGASGSEVVVVADLSIPRAYNVSAVDGGVCYLFPLVVQAGSRIAANYQSDIASEGVKIALTLFDDGFASYPGGGQIDTYGFTSTTTHGTTLDGGSTANTKGAYAQITASTTNDLAGFFIGFDSPGATGATSEVGMSMDVAIGASGSEVIILPDLQFNVKCLSSPARSICPGSVPFLPIPIPAGTRIAARIAASSATTNLRTINVILYGVRA